jgi:hypothetical protein
MTTSKYSSSGGLSVNDEDAQLIREALRSGNTFDLLSAQVGRGNYCLSVNWYRDGGTYYFKVTNDSRRGFIRDYDAIQK